MTHIVLLSDTHSHLDKAVLDLCQSADEIWHAGDIGRISLLDELREIAPVRAVYGNIDSHDIRRQCPEHQKFTLEEARVWMTHIGGYPGRYSPNIRREIQQDPPDIFISGHSHILKVMPDKKLGLLHMNPGAIGLQGFHQVRTLLRFNLAKGRVQDLELAEFKR